MTFFSKYYTRQGLWTLFLMCALPLHIWTIILSLRDFSWISERTNAWDAVGVIAYGLLFALLESVGYFTVAVFAGFLVSTQWEKRKRIVLLSTLVIILAVWGMLGQLFFLWQIPVSDQFIHFTIQTGRPLVALYAIALLFIVSSFSFLTWRILLSKKLYKSLWNGIDNLSLLMLFYLVLDFFAIAIIIFRNL